MVPQITNRRHIVRITYTSNVYALANYTPIQIVYSNCTAFKCYLFVVLCIYFSEVLTTTTENRSLFFSSSEVDFGRLFPSVDEEWIEEIEDVDELEDVCDGMNWSNSFTLSRASRVSSLAME